MMGGRRSARKKQRWDWRRALPYFLLLLCFGLGFYIAQLYADISEMIAQREQALTSAVFSAPLAIRPGEDATRLRLLNRLEHLSYTRVEAVRDPGEYSLAPGSITIFLRAFRIGRESYPAETIRLVLNGSRIAEVADAFGVPMKKATLEPEVIGRLLPGAPAERSELPLSELKPYFIRALIATEDRYFHYHLGFDPVRIIEAALTDLRSRHLSQGASTITQQLARTFIGVRTRSFTRKLQEAAVALVIELRLSKDQILERYINDVAMGEYGGTPIYGLPLAARYLFNKDLREVSIAEAAELIGMIQAPSLYDPRRHPEACRRRRDVVLSVMRKAGLIDEAAYAEASSEPVKVASSPGLRRAPYFTDYVTQAVKRLPGFDGNLEGLKVYTTLDTELQREAQDAITGNLSRIEKIRPSLRVHDEEQLQGALVALDVQTGAIVALVGGRDYAASQFDRATQAVRQMGSSFKPFVYLAALDPARSPLGRPLTLASPLPDRPMSFGGWTPVDYEGNYRGQTTVVQALADSLNLPTAYLGSLLGPPLMVRTAYEFGIHEEMPAVLPIALGAGETTLLELTSAYQVFADEGVARPAYAIESVVDGKGTVIFEHRGQEARLISQPVAYLITGALEEVIRSGTAASAARLGLDFPAAGKTGTTQDYHDAYFVGYTPRIACGVRVGFDKPRSIGLTGAQAALPAWVRFMENATAPDSADFDRPLGITMATIDPSSGGLATVTCPQRATLPFLTGTQPTWMCPLHAGAPGTSVASTASSGNFGQTAPASNGQPAQNGVLSGIGHFFASLFGY
jgi:penicillin-binding protein 1B